MPTKVDAAAEVATILLVGEDRATLEHLATELHRDGHSVRAVASDRAKRLQVPTDIALAVIDGVGSPSDRVDAFRHLALDCGLPVAVVDHDGSLTERLLWLELGARDVLPGNSARQLVEQVRALARRPPAGRHRDELVVGPLRLDLALREVRGPRGRARLTRQESLLLEFLMRHPGQVFDRGTLLERVWGHRVGTASTVSVHMRRLREKIEPDPNHPALLVTVWSSGYCLEPHPHRD